MNIACNSDCLADGMVCDYSNIKSGGKCVPQKCRKQRDCLLGLECIKTDTNSKYGECLSNNSQ